MNKLYTLLLIFLSYPLSLTAQTTSPGFDSLFAAKFQQAIDSTMSVSGILGESVSLIVPSQGTFIGVAGESYSGVPIAPDTRFCIASNTKLFLATTLLKLQEQGLLSLDDHLDDWIPSYPNIDSSATIRQCLSHESGFYDPTNEYPPNIIDTIFADTTRIFSPEEVLQWVGPPHFAPGHGYFYSNTNYFLAQLVIEQASDTSLLNNLHQYIFDPVDMDSSFLAVFETPNGPVAHQWYGGYDLGGNPLPSWFSIMSAAAGIFSTANEMATWYHELFSGNFISQNSMQQLLNFEPCTSYSLGLQVMTYNGFNYYFHTGQTMNYLSIILYDQVTKSTIALLTNDVTANVFAQVSPLLDILHNDMPKQANDAGISAVLNPLGNGCSSSVTPLVTLKNFGSNLLTSVTINLQVDSGTISSLPWSGNLMTDSSVQVSLPAISLSAGDHQFNCYSSNPNGLQEGYAFNDGAQVSFIVNTNAAQTVLNEGFENPDFPPAGWYAGGNQYLAWGKSHISHYDGIASAVRNNYNDPTIGSVYDLELPMLNLASFTDPMLFFNVAYAMYPGYFDSLAVMISTDCGATYQTLFHEGGTTLATAPSTYNFFVPEDGQWESMSVNLSGNNGDVLVKFRDICGYSNNLFIDGITISDFTGINEVQPQIAISLYPNPFHDVATIKLSHQVDHATCLIYDIAGKELRRLSVNGSQKIILDRGGLINGFYFFRLMEQGEQVGQGKFVVE